MGTTTKKKSVHIPLNTDLTVRKYIPIGPKTIAAVKASNLQITSLQRRKKKKSQNNMVRFTIEYDSHSSLFVHTLELPGSHPNRMGKCHPLKKILYFVHDGQTFWELVCCHRWTKTMWCEVVMFKLNCGRKTQCTIRVKCLIGQLIQNTTVNYLPDTNTNIICTICPIISFTQFVVFSASSVV